MKGEREKMERKREERARGNVNVNLRGNGLSVSLGFCDHIRLLPELQVNDGGQQATGFTVYLHRNSAAGNDVSTFALSDARSVATGLQQGLLEMRGEKNG